jgi:formiminotetrahydrofolate cyclodeaminase
MASVRLRFLRRKCGVINLEDLDSFMNRLASGSPAPGGGAASALVSVVASSLASMVSALTINKKGYEAEKARMQEIEKTAADTSTRLRNLMKEDEAAFNLIVSAWGLPKGSDAEKARRKEEIEKATLVAINVPIKIARESLAILEMASYLTARGNKNAITDSACASEFAMAALRGSLYNARINLKSISNPDMRTEIDAKIRMILDTGLDLYRDNEGTVRKMLA